MDSQLRPLGLAYTVAGSLLLSIGISRIQGAVELLDWIQPALLIGVGALLGHLGTRFGGMNWLPQFLLIGLMFLWGGLHAHDSFDRWFGLWMGAMFTLSAGVSIVAAIFGRGLRSALLDTSSAVIVVPGHAPAAFSAGALAEAIREAAEAQQGTDPPVEDQSKLT